MRDASACLLYFYDRPNLNPFLEQGEIISRDVATYVSAAKLEWQAVPKLTVDLE